MKLSQVKVGSRFYWAGNKAQIGSYCLKCTWLVVFSLTAQRFAVLPPWTAVSDVEESHTDPLPAESRINAAHQQAVGILFFLLLLLLTCLALLWWSAN